MKRVLAVCLILVLAVASAWTQEDGEKPVSMGIYAGAGFPTYAGIGARIPNNMFEIGSGILSAVEFALTFGTSLDAPQRFVKSEQKGLYQDSNGYYWYENYPADGLDASAPWSLGVRSYLTVYELDLGALSLPINTGFSLAGGGTGGSSTDRYMFVESEVALKIDVNLEALPLITPYIELGIGGGSGSPMNDSAKEKISGLSSAPDVFDSDSPEYARWFMSSWKYTGVLVNVGARLNITLGGKDDEPEEEAEPEPEVDTRVSEFLFPEWLMDLGGLTYHPGGPMDGAYILGAQKMFRNYSFKYQSSIFDEKFNHKFEPESIVEIVQADDEVYHAIFTTEDGEEMEFKLVRLQEGETKTIDGEEIEPLRDGVYFDGKVFETMEIGVE